MAASRFRGTARIARVTVYIAVLATLFLLRGRLGMDRLLPSFPGAADSTQTLRVAGAALAPALLEQLLASYRRDYPALDIRAAGGGTAHALEELIHGRADVAFLCRAPSIEEQDLFRAVDRDTALWFPVALGGIVVLAGADAAADSLSLEELRALATGSPTARFDRLFVADPNLGLWDAARSQLGIASMEQPRQVIFLENEAAVLGAVAADPRAAGLASSLSLPRDLASLGTRALALRPDAAGPAADPGYEEIAYGEYPLHHHLLAACRARGSIQGTMFVTHLTSDRGQRQVERAGFLPARQTLREVVITRDPIGKTG